MLESGPASRRRKRAQGRTTTIRQRGVKKSPPAGHPCPGWLLLTLPAVLLVSACVASPQTGITSSSSPSQVITGPGAAGVPSTSTPLETTQASNKAPVYWIGRSNDNVFLYREFRDVSEQENPVTRALRVMMSEKPLDPDFFSPWQNPKKLATSVSGKNVITVDVSPDAFNSNVDAETAERAIQQLVYTATAAAASSGLIDSGQQIQVVMLVDGRTDYVAFNYVRLGFADLACRGDGGSGVDRQSAGRRRHGGGAGHDQRPEHDPRRKDPLGNPARRRREDKNAVPER